MHTNGTQRPWRLIAQELAEETDINRILQLSEALDVAMEALGPSDLADTSGVTTAAKQFEALG